MDAHSEALVQEALSRLTKGRTVLVIAHRLSTVVNADKICVLSQGKARATNKYCMCSYFLCSRNARILPAQLSSLSSPTILSARHATESKVVVVVFVCLVHTPKTRVGLARHVSALLNEQQLKETKYCIKCKYVLKTCGDHV